MWQKQNPNQNSAYELLVNFEINNPGGVRYRRPYVALWIEDKKGFPVRTISLWAQTTPPGPRWIPDMRRWFRSDRIRQFTDKKDLVATVSSPTRQPGKYSLLWDGTNDQNNPVKPGEYTVYLEAVREHGTYQILKRVITVADRPFKAELGGNEEIKSATLEYRRRRA